MVPYWQGEPTAEAQLLGCKKVFKRITEGHEFESCPIQTFLSFYFMIAIDLIELMNFVSSWQCWVTKWNVYEIIFMT